MCFPRGAWSFVGRRPRGGPRSRLPPAAAHAARSPLSPSAADWARSHHRDLDSGAGEETAPTPAENRARAEGKLAADTAADTALHQARTQGHIGPQDPPPAETRGDRRALRAPASPRKRRRRSQQPFQRLPTPNVGTGSNGCGKFLLSTRSSPRGNLNHHE